MSALIHAEPALTARTLRDARQLVSLIHEWRELYESCPDATPFQHPEWMLAWIKAFSPRDLLIIEIRDQGHLIGLAPLLVYSRNDDRVLAFAGGGVSDYLGLLAREGREASVMNSVLQCISDIPGWNVLELTDIPQRSFLARFPVFKPYLHEHDPCSVLVLPAMIEELLQIFSARQRANLRNAHSRLQRAGDVHVEIADAHSLPEFMDDLFRLHTARWCSSGEPGVLNEERTRAFHKLCSPSLLASGILKLHRLRVNGHTAAVLHSLWERGTVYCYLQGFDPEQSFGSPGTYLIYEAIKDAVKHRMRQFDFLRGQERYKQHWRAEPQTTYRIQIPRSALPFAVV